jgi:hypothetical protein
VPRPYSSAGLAAAFFDPETGGFPVMPDGQLRGTHPVDQAVALSLLPLGSLVGIPETGLDVQRIKRASSRTVAAVVLAAVQQALQPLIDADDIGSLSVGLLTGQSGVTWVVSYENLRAPRTERKTAVREVRLLPRR